MKKLTIILLLTLIPILAPAQAMIGYTYNEIWDHWDDPYCERSKKTTNQGVLFISIITPRVHIGYYFNQYYECDQVYIFPKRLEYVNEMVERYNGSYTIIDNRNWDAYFSESICHIKLMYSNDVKYPFFYWE